MARQSKPSPTQMTTRPARSPTSARIRAPHRAREYAIVPRIASPLTTYCLRRGRRSAPFALVTLGPGPSPSATSIPPPLLAAAQAGLADASKTLALPDADLTVHAVGPRRTTADAVAAAAFMAAAVRAGRDAGFVPLKRPASRGKWFIADKRPWPGPDTKGVWIRNPHSMQGTWTVIATVKRIPETTTVFVGPSGKQWRFVGRWHRSGPYHWRYAYPYTHGMQWVLAPDDPTDQLHDGDILRPAGPHHYEISGEHIKDIPSLCRALERAVGGAEDSWGWTLDCIEDRLYGGFGMDHPCTLTWQRSDLSRRIFDARALAEWATRRLAAGDYLDEQGRAWLTQLQADGRAGRRTLFDRIIELLAFVGERKPLRLVLA